MYEGNDVRCILYDKDHMSELRIKNRSERDLHIELLAVEWFLRRENNEWLGWKRITQLSMRTFNGR